MDERVAQFRVGVMVLATFIIGGILVALFGSLPNLTVPTKTIYISFPAATGVSRDTPVRKYGMLIGRVKEVEFAPQRGVKVTAEIFSRIGTRKVELYTDEICQVQNSLLGGDAIISFIGEDMKLLPPSGQRQEIQDGDLLLGIAAVDPAQAIMQLQNTMAQAVTSVVTTSDEIGRLAHRVTVLLDDNDDQIQRVAIKAEATLDRIYSIAEHTDDVLGDKQVRDNFKKAMADLPAVLHDTSAAIKGFQGTMEVADRNLQNLEGLTKPLGQKGPELVESIDRTVKKLDLVLAEMQQFSKSLNNPNSSIGRLANDRQMYDRVNAAVSNIETLTRDMKPVVQNARVFSDRIARHPEVLGVGGAIRPSSGAK